MIGEEERQAAWLQTLLGVFGFKAMASCLGSALKTWSVGHENLMRVGRPKKTPIAPGIDTYLSP